MTTTHETLAREIAADPGVLAIHATASARQGDLLLRRIGAAPDGDLPVAALLLAAGNHGQHWAVGPARRDGDTLAVQVGTIIVHTDVPSARHRAISLAAGQWQIGAQRELGLDLAVQKVVD